MSGHEIKLIDVINEAFVGNNKKSAEDVSLTCAFFEKYYGGKSRNSQEKREKIFNTHVSELIKQSDDFTRGIIDGVKSFPNDKYTLTKRLEAVLSRLEYHGLLIDNSLLNNFKYRDKNERLLMILKHLHDGEKTRDEIADAFGISNRQLAEDLGTLLDGFEFLGCTMKIEELERKKNTYRSIIHPVFMAFNTAEIYAMTIGLKKISRGTIFEDTLGRIADAFYTQLSDHTKGLIDSQKYLQKIRFKDDDLHFVNSHEFLRRNKIPLVYFLKDQIPCEVTYEEDGKKVKIRGTLHLPEYENQGDIVILKSEAGEKIINRNSISDISRLD